jgi:hypothetical protein
MKSILLIFSAIVFGIGIYLLLFTDVPDDQVRTNLFTSWFLIIVGTGSALVNLMWSSSAKKK